MSTDSTNQSSPPPLLYKYRAVNEFTEDILARQEIYCSSPLAFNDPFECRPILQLDVSSPAGKEWFKTEASKRGVSPARRLRLAAQIKRRHAEPRTAEEMGLDNLYRLVGVYSLSANRVDPLMWAHYSDSHKGICIEFDTKQWPFNLAWRVNYSTSYPIIDRSRQTPIETMNASILTKALSWKYEDEWRLIMRTPDQKDLDQHAGRSDDVGKWTRAQHGPGKYKIPKESITSVILGMRISKEDKNRVLEWIKIGGISPRVQQAERSKTEFLISVQDHAGKKSR